MDVESAGGATSRRSLARRAGCAAVGAAAAGVLGGCGALTAARYAVATLVGRPTPVRVWWPAASIETGDLRDLPPRFHAALRGFTACFPQGQPHAFPKSVAAALRAAAADAKAGRPYTGPGPTPFSLLYSDGATELVVRA